MKRSGIERALSAVTNESRRAAAPEVDWDRVESRLFTAIARDDQRGKTSRKAFAAWWLVPIAVVLSLVVWETAHERARGSHASVAAAPVDAPLDGDALGSDEVLQAGESPLRIAHSGRAEWTLEPNARASVIEHGDIVRIRLEAGALRAHVVPTSAPERFVVEAANLRVAVHGTVFRVELKGDRGLVDVEQGVVAAGPRARPTDPSALLRAPAHAEFSLEGVNLLEPSIERVPASAEPDERSAMAHKPRRSSAVSAPGPSPDVASADAAVAVPASSALTIGEVETQVASIVGVVTRCFRENTPASGNLRVSARTNVTLVVTPQGNVQSVTFAPPLAPSVQNCSEREVSAVHFRPSNDGAHITRVLELSR